MPEEITLDSQDDAILDGIEADIRKAGGWQNFDPMRDYGDSANVIESDVLEHKDEGGHGSEKRGVKGTSKGKSSKLTIQAATKALAKQGIELGKSHFDLDTKQTSYLLTHKDGSKQWATSKEIKSMINGKATVETSHTKPEGIEAAGDADNFKYGSREPDDDFYYHITPETNLSKILEHGFAKAGNKPTMGDGFYREASKGKTFITDRQGVGSWRDRIQEHLESQMDEDDPPKLVVARFPKSSVKVLPDPNRSHTDPNSWVLDTRG